MRPFGRSAPGQAFLVLIAAVLLSSAAGAQRIPDEPRTAPVKREILALYDSREDAARPDPIHRFAEMPLNHFGFVVTYWDVNTELPGAERTADARGVITWFRRAQRASFYQWARQQVARGLRMVVLGDGGLPSGGASLADANRLFAEIGFAERSRDDITYGTRVSHRDGIVGFERLLGSGVAAVPDRRTFGADVASHLILSIASNPVLASSVVLTSNRAATRRTDISSTRSSGPGAPSGSSIHRVLPKGVRRRDPADPRRDHAVGPPHVVQPYRRRRTTSRAPRPIATSRRSPRSSSCATWSSPTRPAGGGRRDGADVDERYGTPEVARQAARELCTRCRRSRRQSHPRSISGASSRTTTAGWRSGSSAPAKANGRPCSATAGARWCGACSPDWRGRRKSRANSSTTIRRARSATIRSTSIRKSAAPSPRPRTWRRRGSGERSTCGAGRLILEGAIARTRRLGLRNLNGGDSRYDADYPSISYLSPISRPAGAERQIYAANANDYIYITDGGGRPHGVLHLETTVNATESPRRLKPINVYYHMYAGENAAGLAGVRHHLDSARQALLTPVAASHYAAIADGFFSARMSTLAR
jgi:hypothetical protein